MSTHNIALDEASAREYNALFRGMVDRGQAKEAAMNAEPFLRHKLRQEAICRHILTPDVVSRDRLVPDEVTDQPSLLINLEPDSVATVATLRGQTKRRWFKGKRVRVGFHKLMSERFVKNEDELDTYDFDIRKVIADNFVKDLADVEDDRFFTMCEAAVGVTGQTVASDSTTFTSGALLAAKQILRDLRLPVGKLALSETLLETVITRDSTILGDSLQKQFFENGVLQTERVWGVDTVLSIKNDIIPPNEAWLFTTEPYLGRFYVRREPTLFVRKEDDMLEMYAHESVAQALVRIHGVVKITFDDFDGTTDWG